MTSPDPPDQEAEATPVAIGTSPEPPDQEPEAPASGVAGASPKTRRSLSRVRRELSDDDLLNPAVARLLVGEVDRLELEVADLKGIRDRFYDADKQVSVLRAKLSVSRAWDVISTACVTVGAAALGYAPNLWDAQPAGWLVVVFGGVVVASGIIARIVRNES